MKITRIKQMIILTLFITLNLSISAAYPNFEMETGEIIGNNVSYLNTEKKKEVEKIDLEERITDKSELNISVPSKDDKGNEIKLVDKLYYQFIKSDNEDKPEIPEGNFDYNESKWNEKGWQKIGKPGVASTIDIVDSKLIKSPGYLKYQKYDLSAFPADNAFNHDADIWKDITKIFSKTSGNINEMSTKLSKDAGKTVFLSYDASDEDVSQTRAYKFWGFISPANDGEYRFAMRADDGLRASIFYDGKEDIFADYFEPTSDRWVPSTKIDQFQRDGSGNIIYLNEEAQEKPRSQWDILDYNEVQKHTYNMKKDEAYPLTIFWYNSFGPEVLEMYYQKRNSNGSWPSSSSWTRVPENWFYSTFDNTPGYDVESHFTVGVEEKTFKFPSAYGYYHVALDLSTTDKNKRALWGWFLNHEQLKMGVTNPDKTETIQKFKIKDGKAIVEGWVIDKYVDLDEVKVVIIEHDSNIKSINFNDTKKIGEYVTEGTYTFNNILDRSEKKNFTVELNPKDFKDKGKYFDIYVKATNKHYTNTNAIDDMAIEKVSGKNDEGVILDDQAPKILQIEIENQTTSKLWKNLTNYSKPIFDRTESFYKAAYEGTTFEGKMSDALTRKDKLKFFMKRDIDTTKQGELPLTISNGEGVYFKNGDTLELTLVFEEENFDMLNKKNVIIAIPILGFEGIPNTLSDESDNKYKATWTLSNVMVSGNGRILIEPKIVDMFENKIEESINHIEVGIIDNEIPVEGNLNGVSDSKNYLDFNTGPYGEDSANFWKNKYWTNKESYSINLKGNDNGTDVYNGNTGIRAYLLAYEYDGKYSDQAREGIRETNINIISKHINDLDVVTNDEKTYYFGAAAADGELKRENSGHYDDGRYKIVRILPIDKAGNFPVNISGNVITDINNGLSDLNFNRDIADIFVDTIKPEITNVLFEKVSDSILDSPNLSKRLQFSKDGNNLQKVKFGDTFRLSYEINEYNFAVQSEFYKEIKYENFADGEVGKRKLNITLDLDETSGWKKVTIGDEFNNGGAITVKEDGSISFVEKVDKSSIGVNVFRKEDSIAGNNEVAFEDLAGNVSTESFFAVIDNTPPTPFKVILRGDEPSKYNKRDVIDNETEQEYSIKTRVEKKNDFDNLEPGSDIIYFTANPNFYVCLQGNSSDLDIVKYSLRVNTPYVISNFDNDILYVNGVSDNMKIDKLFGYQPAIENIPTEIDFYTVDDAGWISGVIDTTSPPEIDNYRVISSNKATIFVDTEVKASLNNGFGTAIYEKTIGSGDDRKYEYTMNFNLKNITDVSGLWKYQIIGIDGMEGIDGNKNFVGIETVFSGYIFPAKKKNKFIPDQETSDTPVVYNFQLPENSKLIGSRVNVNIRLTDNIGNTGEFDIPYLIPKPRILLKSKSNEREKNTGVRVVGETEFELMDTKER